MSDSTKNELEGKLHEAKGAVKEKVGEILKKPDMEADGAAESLGGTVQKKAGQVQKVFEK